MQNPQLEAFKISFGVNDFLRWFDEICGVLTSVAVFRVNNRIFSLTEFYVQPRLA